LQTFEHPLGLLDISFDASWAGSYGKTLRIGQPLSPVRQQISGIAAKRRGPLRGWPPIVSWLSSPSGRDKTTHEDTAADAPARARRNSAASVEVKTGALRQCRR